MALNGVEKARYAELANDIIDKIVITGRRGFALVINALKKVVLNRATNPREQRIPQGILDRAQQLKDLLSESSLWIPMDRKKRANPHYRKEVYKKRHAFEHLVQSVVRNKIRDLRFMPLDERKKLIQVNCEKLKQQAAMQAAMRQLNQRRLEQPPEILSQAQQAQRDEEQEQHVIERIQWRIQLSEPMEAEEGVTLRLDMNEVGRLAHLIDMEKYPEMQAMQLTQSFYLAKWLASEAICGLISQDKLVATHEQHLTLLTNPTDNQMRRLSLLAPFIAQDMISVQDALEVFMDENCYTLLDNAGFQERTKTQAFTDGDKFILEMMGIVLPRRNELRAVK